MKLRNAIIVGAIGAAAIYYGPSRINSEFSGDAVFRRASERIERLIKDPAVKERTIDELRTSLGQASDDTARCRAGVLAEVTANTGGNKKAAEKIIERRSLTPYLECEPSEREANSDNKWIKYGGILLAVVGVGSQLIKLWDTVAAWLAKRKREKPPRAAKPARRREEGSDEEGQVRDEDRIAVLRGASRLLEDVSSLLENPSVESVDRELVLSLRDNAIELRDTLGCRVPDVCRVGTLAQTLFGTVQLVRDSIRSRAPPVGGRDSDFDMPLPGARPVPSGERDDGVGIDFPAPGARSGPVDTHAVLASDGKRRDVVDELVVPLRVPPDDGVGGPEGPMSDPRDMPGGPGVRSDAPVSRRSGRVPRGRGS